MAPESLAIRKKLSYHPPAYTYWTVGALAATGHQIAGLPAA
jgi:hypothetical protein